jgi:hypothetical protein
VAAAGESRLTTAGFVPRPDWAMIPTRSSGFATRTGSGCSPARSPSDAIRLGLTEIEGAIPPVTLLGRWIDRAEGVDGPSSPEERQRLQQARNAGSWGSKVSANGASADAGDPAEGKRPKGGLMSYEQLYALWERRTGEPTSSTSPRIASTGSPVPPRPRGTRRSHRELLRRGGEGDRRSRSLPARRSQREIEAFLATQLVDEMRHAVFFDRWANEVMGLESGSFRERLREIEDRMLGPWHFLFDDSSARSPTGSRRGPTTWSCSSRGSSPTTWSPRESWRCPASGS